MAEYIELERARVEFKRFFDQGISTVLPCKIGDEVYAIRYYKGQANVMKGIVGELFFTQDMKLMIVVKHICRGHWLETVFPTFETAALEVRKRKNIKAGTCRKEET